MKNITLSLLLLLLLTPATGVYAQKPNQLKVDKVQVDRWNLFTKNVYALHKQQLKNYTTEKTVSLGGYHRYENFFEEERYIDSKSKKLLSRIQWERSNPDNIHLIEVFVYDRQGILLIDYLSAYLPEHRNAPIQTLINLHYQDKHLQAYRQFDASGDRIYEQCKGNFFGTELFISLDEIQIPFGKPAFEDSRLNEAYPSCFGDIATEASIYLNPLNAGKLVFSDATKNYHGQSDSDTLLLLTKTILKEPNNANAYFDRGVLHFQEQDFTLAINDLTKCLTLNPANDEALFWRGMAYGRNKQSDKGIADLSQYILKHPDNSRAYTKRGVRYIWAGKLDKAMSDLKMAIKLDSTNSEAHDDLGVLYAQQKNYPQAILHFSNALKYDPSYQKAWHNRAMLKYVQHQFSLAIDDVDQSLALKATRDSMLLKSLIMDALGKKEMANRIRVEAERLPDNNWSESFAIQ